jgi:hypothetical protein
MFKKIPEIVYAKPGEIISYDPKTTKIVVVPPIGHTLTEQEYQEYLEYKKWLDSPCCSLNNSYMSKPTSPCSEHFFDQETLEDCKHKELYTKKGKISFCKNCDKVIATAIPIDQGTQEDIIGEWDNGRQLVDNLEKDDVCDCCQPCPEENKHCSCIHIPYEVKDNNDLLWDEIETLEDRVDDLEGEVRTLQKQMKAQILINKVK